MNVPTKSLSIYMEKLIKVDGVADGVKGALTGTLIYLVTFPSCPMTLTTCRPC